VVRYSPSSKDSTSLKGQNVNGLFSKIKIIISGSVLPKPSIVMSNEDYSMPLIGKKPMDPFLLAVLSPQVNRFYSDSLLLTFWYSWSHPKIKLSYILSSARIGSVRFRWTRLACLCLLPCSRFEMIDLLGLCVRMYFNGIDQPAYPVQDLYIEDDSLVWWPAGLGFFSYSYAELCAL
jgi:hypothetical protein